MEGKEHKRKRIKEVNDLKDANKVDPAETATESEVTEAISSVNGGKKKHKRKQQGSGSVDGSDVLNAAEVLGNDDAVDATREKEGRKKKKRKNEDNLGEEQGVRERKPGEGMMVEKDYKKEKDGKRKKKKEAENLAKGLSITATQEADGENGGRSDQTEKERRKKKHKEDLRNGQEIGEREQQEGVIERNSKKEKEGKRGNKKQTNNHGDTLDITANGEVDNNHGGRSDQIEERRKKQKRKHNGNLENEPEVGERAQQEATAMVERDDKEGRKRVKKKQEDKLTSNDENVKEKKMSKKKKVTDEALKVKEKDGKKLRAKRTKKKVTFADEVQVFPATTDKDNSSEGNNSAGKSKIVQGKRFSKEEDALVKEAVFKFIESHNLGEEGLDMVLHCKDHPEIRYCWREIASSIPWRPYVSVYHRAHTIFQRGDNGTWTPEECELIRNHYEKHGADWKTLGEALGRHRIHVKDTWRRIKLPNAKKGAWSHDEYQTLFDLVNLNLRMRALEEEKQVDLKHGMLRDNIPWEAISQKLSTRNNALCCIKWYNQLTSPMVSEGIWADTDDYRLVDALVSLDACSMEDVDWDNLIEQRPGDVCRRRWSQMANQIGDHGIKSFSQQVDILCKRYCPEMIDAREAWDQKLREAAEANAND